MVEAHPTTSIPSYYLIATWNTGGSRRPSYVQVKTLHGEYEWIVEHILRSAVKKER